MNRDLPLTEELPWWTHHRFLYVFFAYFQMQLSESSQPVWVEFTATLGQSTDEEGEQSSVILIKSGVVSYDGE